MWSLILDSSAIEIFFAYKSFRWENNAKSNAGVRVVIIGLENQATDRAYRIGQSKKVTVHRLITKNSFEEKIDKMIKAKQELSDLSVNIGESWLKDMDKKQY